MADEWLDLVAELIQVADERADVEYLEVSKGDLFVRFGRGAAGAAPAATPAPLSPVPLTPVPLTPVPLTPVPLAPAPIAAAPSQIAPSESAAPNHAAPASAAASRTPAAATSAPAEIAGTTLVRSPMVGTFYRAPAPGKPPFIEVGAAVTTDSTLGLVEAMKVFTSIRADIDGTIEEIFVGDSEFIEFDQPLFRVRSA